VAIAATGVFFCGLQLVPAVAEVWSWGLGALQWPARALVSAGLPPIRPVAVTMDPTDLVALPALGVAWWVGGRR